jgi:hypothetical protein
MSEKPPVRPVVDVAIIPTDPDACDAAIVDVTLEPTGADVFGEPVPGEAVVARERIDPCSGYAPRYLRSRFGRRMDGKPVRLKGSTR